MPNKTTTANAGLFIKGDTSAAVPLAGVSIDAEIRSVYARVVIAQRFVNREAVPIEAVYVFPLDEGAAVCGFEAVIDGTLVVGEVHERDKAFEMYDDAMEQGHGAYLLDEERPDVFQASVGNLPPGKEVSVRLTYVTEVPIADGQLRFTVPTTVSPRYAPANDHTGVGRPDAQALNPPVAWSVPYGLSLAIRLSMPGAIASVECPSHPIAVAMNGGDATVTLARQDAAMDRDFVLTISAAGLDAPHAVVERGDDGTCAVAAAFAPRFEAASAPAEVIFLVDRSGSMQGTSISEVRNALQLCLRSMTPACRFNIVGFGSKYEALFPESRAYEEATLAAATGHVSALEADLGGTEILPALQFVLERPADAGLPRQVVVLTDGEVTNTDAVLELARSQRARARIFTFGIGAGASHHLVRGLARAGGGSVEFIHPGERIEPKVLRLFAGLLSPSLTDVRVEWTGGDVTQSPEVVPHVFAGARLQIYGFVKDGHPARARLTATGPTGRLAFEVPLDVEAVPGRIVATLAARARIRELEEGSEWLAARGSRQRERKAAAASREIVALATKYGLASRETSFVAIERRETLVTGEVRLRKVPIALTTGWGGLQDAIGSRDYHPMHMGTVRLGGPVPLSAESLHGWRPVPESGVEPSSSQRTSPPRSSLWAYPLKLESKPVAPAGLDALIRLQAADGSWELTPKLAAILGRSLRDVASAVSGATGPREEIERAWATALALAWLRLHAVEFGDEWRMLAAKGRTRVENSRAILPGGRTWLEEARRFLEP